MIYVIMYRGVSRGERISTSATENATAFMTGAVLAGAVIGYSLGWFGSMIPLGSRAALGAALALAGIFIGACDVIGRCRVGVFQLNRETNQRWLARHRVRGAFATGIVIGAGFATRVGFWLWYVIPVGCLLLARPKLSAGIYGTYALTRAAVPILLSTYAAVAQRRDVATGMTAHRLQEKMLRATRPIPVRALCGAWLVLVASAFLAT